MTCARAGIIWLHGLGDSGAGWTFLQDELSDLKHITWSFPDAPYLPITLAENQRMPAWFDIYKIPVSPSSVNAETLDGINDAVATVHRLIENMKQQGIPAERIVVGGFSQGACTAVLAGLASNEPIAGIAAFSGWLPHEKHFSAVSPLNRRVLVAHGTADEVVQFPLGQILADRLQAMKHTVEFKTYRGMGHTSNMQEINDFRTWLSQVLP
ncbi:acyl-protein thioesterase 1,2 [Thraustotheca clavata]|uniref:Acyl-protein thioesterase 1,2 n=1 Tax=Thraustotheca clavata TaxID=74557 RepID=A0A1W0A6J2_9STRA|nr:acyl-protein thioesterase 1,2 [Thraustotheca clavata]